MFSQGLLTRKCSLSLRPDFDGLVDRSSEKQNAARGFQKFDNVDGIGMADQEIGYAFPISLTCVRYRAIKAWWGWVRKGQMSKRGTTADLRSFCAELYTLWRD